MASLVDIEAAALAAAVGQGKPLPELRKAYFEAMLTGGIPARVGVVDGTLLDVSQVGAVVESVVENVSMTTSTRAVTSVVLPAGVWLVKGSVTWRTSGDGQVALNTSTEFPSPFYHRGYGTSSSSLNGGTARAPERVFNFTQETTVYLMGNFSSSNTSHAIITAIRIQ